MNTIVIILVMVLIGALIGGMTNFIAIKMLFRPYKALYIGKYKLPFTPGLIPKRQGEMAIQLGNTVVNHLLTPEGMTRKLLNEQFVSKVTDWIGDELEKIMETDLTINDTVQKYHLPIDEKTLEQFTKEKIKSTINRFIVEHQLKELNELVPLQLKDKVELYIPRMSRYVLLQLAEYVESEEGKEKIGKIAEQYLGSRGFFGNMISSFLGGDGLATKIQPAISQFLQSKDAHVLINRLIKKEYENLLNKEVRSFLPILKEKNISEWIATQLMNFITFHEWFEMKWKDLYRSYQEPIRIIFLPNLVTGIQGYLTANISYMMKKVKINEIVQEEVEKFDLKRLEEMVLSITSKELKMITYLGALLGGVIGAIQAIFVFLMT